MDETAESFADGRLRLSRKGSITVLELNQPARRNAISQAMWRALPDVVRQIEADAGCRAVIVRGASKMFSAGADISEFSEIYADWKSSNACNNLIRFGLQALRDLDRPTIGLVDGICVGGGCATALACDLRFAATDARFAITPAKLGLSYSIGDTRRLMEKVGAARAKDILFSQVVNRLHRYDDQSIPGVSNGAVFAKDQLVINNDGTNGQCNRDRELHHHQYFARQGSHAACAKRPF